MNLYSLHARRLPLPALLVGFVVLVTGLSAEAVAQASSCVMSQRSCFSGTRQRAGSPCQCVDDPSTGSAMMGEVVINGDVSPNYPGYREDERRLQRLRNDDLDDHDDVLAGPRHHPRRRAEPPARDNDD